MLLIVGSAIEPSGRDFYARLLGHARMVIAADAGAEICRSVGRAPDVAVGDWDSIAPETLEWLRSTAADLKDLPPEKDFTDLEAALRVAAVCGERPVTLTAVLGGRLDHTLATLGAMSVHSSLWPVALEPSTSAWVLAPGGRASIDLGPAGATFSVMALVDGSTVTIVGARYPLDDARLAALAPVGVSNVVEGAIARVSVTSGAVAVITSGDGDITRATECGSS